MAGSRNWLAWFPTKMTGPSRTLARCCLPTISMREKKMCITNCFVVNDNLSNRALTHLGKRQSCPISRPAREKKRKKIPKESLTEKSHCHQLQRLLLGSSISREKNKKKPFQRKQKKKKRKKRKEFEGVAWMSENSDYDFLFSTWLDGVFFSLFLYFFFFGRSSRLSFASSLCCRVAPRQI